MIVSILWFYFLSNVVFTLITRFRVDQQGTRAAPVGTGRMMESVLFYTGSWAAVRLLFKITIPESDLI